MLKFTSVSSLLLLLLIPTPTWQQSTRRDPIVETSLGKIRGSILKTQKGREIFAYRGIRYAEPPTGVRRFAAPVPVEAWQETFDATADSLMCPQPGAFELMGEDCLKLNVYTSSEIVQGLPVLVYIHGGANKLGSSHSVYQAGPQYLLDADIVLVTFNYRLGAFGFLSTRSKEAPGNFGYLDQLLVMKWIQAHIHQFGGNPNKVTLFGVSAGGMAVTLHMASPLSTGLFHRAIIMSGSNTNHFVIDNLHWTRKLAEEVACPKFNPQDLLNCLRNVSWQRIIDVCDAWEYYGFINMKFNYEIDGEFLLEHPDETFLHNRTNLVPLMTGTTRDELDFIGYAQENNTGLLNDISINFPRYLSEFLLFQNFSTVPDKNNIDWKATKIQQFYFGNKTKIDENNLLQFGQIFSDGLIGHSVHRLVELASKYTPVYYYRFDYVGVPNSEFDQNWNAEGIVHSGDMRYIMPGLWRRPQMPLNSSNMFMVERMVNFFETFATWGWVTTKEGVHWPSVDPNNVKTLYIDRDLRVDEAPYLERYKVWDEIFVLPKSGVDRQRSAVIMTTIACLLILLIYKM